MEIKHGKYTSQSASKPGRCLYIFSFSLPRLHPSFSSLGMQQINQLYPPINLATFPVDPTYHSHPKLPPSTLPCISFKIQKAPTPQKQVMSAYNTGRLSTDLISLFPRLISSALSLVLQLITSYRLTSPMLTTPLELTGHSFPISFTTVVISKPLTPASIS